MKRKFLWSLTVSFLMIPAFGEVVFPEAKEIPERLKMPLHAKLSVDADGNLLVNGKIRYLIGVKMVSGSPYKDLQPRGGYPEALKWLYEVPMNRGSRHEFRTAVQIQTNSGPDLFQIRYTANIPSFCPSLIQCGKKKPRKNGNHCNYNKKFDQGKVMILSLSHFISFGFSLVSFFRIVEATPFWQR